MLGDILREFNAPGGAKGNGRAVAFDGTFLYLTKELDQNIYRVSTTGTLVNTIPTPVVYGGLQFDPSEGSGVFWAGNYQGNSEIYKIQITGTMLTVLQTINYSGFPLDPTDPVPGHVDGITVDPVTNTIFFGTDEGHSVYNMTKSGVFITSFKTPPEGAAPNGFRSGIASDGLNLWMSLFAEIDGSPRDIVQTNTNGNEITRFTSSTGGYLVEDLEFDPLTFAPKCVLWSNEGATLNNRIRAWEITCPPPPTITCTPDMTVANAPGQCGAIVTYPNPTFTDFCPLGGVTVTCTPPSGSFFPVGTTMVNCELKDACGGTATCSFTVTVNDTEPPKNQCPNNITQANDPGECGAIVIFQPTVTDNCPGVTFSCSPASGSFFSVGTTPVTCTATDASGNTATCSFTVTVNDTESPTIICPANITQDNDPCQSGAVVNFTATASDNCGVASVTCSPSSGSFFNVGTTIVTCTASDIHGNNSSTCTFDVTVVFKPLQEQILDLINEVNELYNADVLSEGHTNSLIVKLNAAIDSLNIGQENAACNQLKAFINEVNGLINAGVLTSTQGQPLIDCATLIRNQIGCKP